MTRVPSISHPQHNHDVYCYLKQCLEPRFSVIAEPQAGYFAQWKFCYRVIDGQQVKAELTGDFRELPEGCLVGDAIGLVHKLVSASGPELHYMPEKFSLPIASRLPPLRDSRTWFSSGRSAFSWLLSDVVKPGRIFLPTYICWSLVDVMLDRFPNVRLEFYSVDRHLNCARPAVENPDDAVVDVHYFGHESLLDRNELQATVLEDCSHCLLGEFATDSAICKTHRFGSLRKVFRVADGGFIDGEFCPRYDADSHTEAWLRLNASDWRDLREAENMVDRQFQISDISSQSLATILATSDDFAKSQRRINNSFLVENFPCGESLVNFADDECPLLHNRSFETPDERNSLRDFLLQHKVFTSIHWPTHQHLLNHRDTIDIEDAVWLQDHTFAIPVAQDFGEREMELICSTAKKWQTAGGSRFSHLAAG